jgi:cyclomaltodextrinase / maltogenic alpha-amylase / neopullulanase
MSQWTKEAVFYHIYPLGFCGAPLKNDFTSPPVERLEKILGWMDHMAYLGTNALYLGPLFESTSHGYDTVNYSMVDRRLGSNRGLAHLTGELHRRGIRVVLDGVFNHVGRDFFAFQDVQVKREASPYKDWFHNMRFDRSSPYHDAFSYEGWNGHYSLVKLNLHNPEVKGYIFHAVQQWITEFDIDGLRLDAADCLEHSFLQELARFCRSLKPDFWLMGEVVHGDYRQWANPNELDSVTNYECYKGLYSSFNDKNFFEIAYAINRQSGEAGIYQNLDLYTFADNHDVDRLASVLKNQAHLIPLYTLMFTMPGNPSIYYGSEFGLEGKKAGTDIPLRPSLDLYFMNDNNLHSDLTQAIHRLSELRRQRIALREGEYRQVHVDHQVFAFSRGSGEGCVLVAINASEKPVEFTVKQAFFSGGPLVDGLDERVEIQQQNGLIRFHLPAYGARIIVKK